MSRWDIEDAIPGFVLVVGVVSITLFGRVMLTPAGAQAQPGGAQPALLDTAKWVRVINKRGPAEPGNAWGAQLSDGSWLIYVSGALVHVPAGAIEAAK